jgi:hypothetical protein
MYYNLNKSETVMKTKDNQDNLVTYAIYPTRVFVENGVQSLQKAGFRTADISVMFASPTTSKEFAHTNETKSPEGATIGGGSGAVIGGVLGLLAGIGVLAIPGAGPFIAAGPIMGTLAGTGVGGISGGLIGALVGAGFPEYEAKRYEGRIREGGILISVHSDDKDWKRLAEKILKDTGASDISSSTESSADFPDKGAPRAQGQ